MTMKSSQDPIKFVIGYWTRPVTTSDYTKEIMSKWSWSSRSPKDIFKGLHYLLTWSNGFCSGRGKRGLLVEKRKGPWQRNDVMMNQWLWAFGMPWPHGFVLGLPQRGGFENNPSDHEARSIWCHVGIHVDFTSILHSHTPLVPQA